MDGKGVACIATSLPSFLFKILLRESNHMCSIIGFCDKRAQYEVVKAALLKTTSRGPDDTRIVDTGNGYLGFNRLAIMGLTDAGMQPFELAGPYVVCHGQLYGPRPPRENLAQEGYAF